jgi:hypothetical protein
MSEVTLTFTVKSEDPEIQMAEILTQLENMADSKARLRIVNWWQARLLSQETNE